MHAASNVPGGFLAAPSVGPYCFLPPLTNPGGADAAAKLLSTARFAITHRPRGGPRRVGSPPPLVPVLHSLFPRFPLPRRTAATDAAAASAPPPSPRHSQVGLLLPVCYRCRFPWLFISRLSRPSWTGAAHAGLLNSFYRNRDRLRSRRLCYCCRFMAVASHLAPTVLLRSSSECVWSS